MRFSQFKKRQSIIGLGLIGLLLVTSLSTVWAAGGNYLNKALVNGKAVTRWNDATPVISVMFQSGAGLKGWSPQRVLLIKNAFSAWQKALNNKIRFVYTQDPLKTDINVLWRQSASGLEVGHDHLRWQNNTFTDADIEIGLEDSNHHPFSDRQISYIALHEIGHMLGIHGHSPDPGDIMYPTLEPKTASLSARDIGTIRALYQQKPQITNPVGIHLLQYRQYQYYLGLAYQAQKEQRYQDSFTYFTKAAQTYPKAPEIAYYVGLSAYNIKRFDIVIPQLRQVLNMPATPLDARYYLGNAYMAVGVSTVTRGNRTEGIQDLMAAQGQFGIILQNPKAPAALKQQARQALAQTNHILQTVQH